ncbi:hypothetical protein MKY92_22335 [Paenibacillus sp. FSL R5-0623]|uniref:hypothetical protein n=1 Tax=Paenibacillus sp. FSL R5-0623 TaxID=2921651 RepID=UPI0030DCB216
MFDESVEFIILDLLQMGKEKPIVVDTFMEPAYLREIVNPNRVVYMFAEDDLISSGVSGSGSSERHGGFVP